MWELTRFVKKFSHKTIGELSQITIFSEDCLKKTTRLT
ncbi:hypothetical protein LEP1GSC082_0778 [Leptospira kirschneri str. H2]|uniref:Uncharacterized protein n=1 Tax=Leptospira kirschneri serovar Bulgarica str. Nikolaevo TaxID=1240687 RepID=M6F0X2_9LEPT|nr:hypothetical protein LEP1GSC082_0778 [Leptospira kirschneri str. H2]EMK21990.1 hypothetical protein LEP1GSC008_0271 [Leptospira kirschneri serovar Bulgarica str. Nikolaevo]